MKEVYNPGYDSVLGFEKAAQWAREGLRKYSILEDDKDFINLYGDVSIKKDMAFVERREQRFRKEATPGLEAKYKAAHILEYIIFEQSELSEWFGSQAHTIKTSRLDDIANGVDMVIEFQDPEDYKDRSFDRLGLAVDISFGVDLSGKFHRIKEEIDNGTLSEVKYFKSERSPAQKLEHLPRIVIGCSGATIDELVKLWTTGDKVRLGNHPLQVQLLHEIQIQLEVFEDYALYVAKNEEMANIYKGLRGIVDPLLAEKRKALGPNARNLYDSGFERIQDGLIPMQTQANVAKPHISPEERSRQIREKFKYLQKKDAA